MKSINIILGNHNHQPVGNFDFCIENVYERSYKAFLDIFKQYPSIKFVFHYTGCLLQWLENNHKEHIDDIVKLVKEKRIEICSGGFYEPILPMISDTDKIEQIRKLNEYIENRFNVKPRGMWLAERVWEQSLTSIIAKSNLEYVILDDSQFRPTFVDRNNAHGYYSTDNSAERINIFPISQPLRYYIPFNEVELAIDYLRSMATEEGDRLLVLHDDGEKYGEWPGTYKWVYEDGWLRRFFEALEREKSWINVTTYSEYMDKYAPLQRVYIPSASYEEMLTWVIPAREQNIYHDHLANMGEHDEMRAFMRGGYWRNFMSKYSESNRMQKIMMYASNLVHSMKDGSQKDIAKDYLFQSQCNCPYWHGTFGGLYLNHLRHATYKNISMAIKLAQSTLYEQNYFKIEEIDFDLDGINEYIISSEKEFIIFDKKSASIVAWNVRGQNDINICDTLRRREEAYHRDIFESAGNCNNNNGDCEVASIHDMKKTFDEDSIKYLVFDRNEKTVCIDHFLLENTDAESFSLLNYQETGSFSNAVYKSNVVGNSGSDIYSIEFISEGNVYGKPLVLKKLYNIYKNGKVEITIEFENIGDEKIDTIYAMENNFTLLAADADDRYYYSIDDSGNTINLGMLCNVGKHSAKVFGLKDSGYTNVDIKLSTDENVDFLYMPIYTISDAVGSLEKIYQGSTVALILPLSIEPLESRKFCLTIEATSC